MLKALRGERYSRTLFRTFFTVQLPPFIAMLILFFGVVRRGILRPNVEANIVLIIWAAGSAIYDLVLIRHARGRLKNLRKLASEDFSTHGLFKRENTPRLSKRSARPALLTVD
jgi:hypothetical protein